MRSSGSQPPSGSWVSASRRVTAVFLMGMTSLLGFRPQVGRCAQCGKPIVLDGLADDDHAAYFGEEAGGVLCKDCGVGGRVRLTAGEVRAEFDKGSERALAYAKQCERAVSGLLRDEDFYFGVAEGTV